MLKSALLAGALALALATPAAANCLTIPMLERLMDAGGASHSLLPQDAIPQFLKDVSSIVGGIPDGVTNVILIRTPEVDLFGLEIDGCVTLPYQHP